MKRIARIILVTALAFAAILPADARKRERNCGKNCCKAAEATEAQAPAKYIFLFIGDGMGHAQVALAESYLSYKAGRLGGEQLSFTQFPVSGFCNTYSADSNITDSSAAGTAISSGTKTGNGMLGVDIDGNPVYSVAVTLQEMGYNIGIYTNVGVNHATPASFFGHDRSRGAYYKIMTQMPEAGYKFYGGSDFIHFAGKNGDQMGSKEYLEQYGYSVAFGQREWEACKDTADRAVLLARPDGNVLVPYTSDEPAENSYISLDQMTRDAIDFLGDEQPFFVMCEGGYIDWTCHSDKTMPTISEIFKLDDAVKAALEFYEAHPDETLILVTADHATGGASLGSDQGGYFVNWKILEDQWEESGHANKLSAEENAKLNRSAGVDWTTTHHTGEPVPIYAKGKGAFNFSGRMDNTDISKKILGL